MNSYIKKLYLTGLRNLIDLQAVLSRTEVTLKGLQTLAQTLKTEIDLNGEYLIKPNAPLSFNMDISKVFSIRIEHYEHLYYIHLGITEAGHFAIGYFDLETEGADGWLSDMLPTDFAREVANKV